MRTPEPNHPGHAGFGAPRIIDPMPSGRPLPLMQTLPDAAKLNVRERITFSGHRRGVEPPAASAAFRLCAPEPPEPA